MWFRDGYRPLVETFVSEFFNLTINPFLDYWLVNRAEKRQTQVSVHRFFLSSTQKSNLGLVERNLNTKCGPRTAKAAEESNFCDFLRFWLPVHGTKLQPYHSTVRT